MIQLLMTLVVLNTAFAWGPEGHQIVAGIADKYLLDSTRIKVRSLLNEESMVQASTWADEIKSQPQYKTTFPWHYVNIEDGKTYANSPKDPGGDVVEAIPRFTAVLTSPKSSLQERQEALKFLIHFIGDIHQPLHVGRGSDRGGNTIKLNFDGKDSNLHYIWDSALIAEISPRTEDIVSQLTQNSNDLSAFGNSPEMVWVQEDLDVRRSVYNYSVNVSGSWQATYSNLSRPIVLQRLSRAGVRLATWLNTNLK